MMAAALESGGTLLAVLTPLVAVPLTVILRIMLLSQPHTQWVAILLGPAVPKITRHDNDPKEA